jgi:hypothetical protein
MSFLKNIKQSRWAHLSHPIGIAGNSEKEGRAGFGVDMAGMVLPGCVEEGFSVSTFLGLPAGHPIEAGKRGFVFVVRIYIVIFSIFSLFPNRWAPTFFLE